MSEDNKECSPPIGETGEGVIGRKVQFNGRTSIETVPSTTTDRLPLPDCLYCGGEVSVCEMIPTGFSVRIHHKKGCAIEAMSGVTVDDAATLERFASAWNTRPVPKADGLVGELQGLLDDAEKYGPHGLHYITKQSEARHHMGFLKRILAALKERV